MDKKEYRRIYANQYYHKNRDKILKYLKEYKYTNSRIAWTARYRKRKNLLQRFRYRNIPIINIPIKNTGLTLTFD